MHARTSVSLSPLPMLDDFAEAVAGPGDARSAPARLQAVIRVLAQATRASLTERLDRTQTNLVAASSPRQAAG